MSNNKQDMTQQFHDKLEQFELALAAHSHEQALGCLHHLLSGFLDLSQGYQVQQDFYLRLVSGVSQWFCDESLHLSKADFHLLSAHHASLSMAFILAGFNNADHVFACIADVSDIDNIVFPDENAAYKCLILYHLSSGYELDLYDFSLAYPDLVSPILLGMLASRCLIDGLAEQRYNSMLDMDWSHLSGFRPLLSNMVSISNSWMFCSYAYTANKHRIKRTLNSIIRNWCSAEGEEKQQKRIAFDFSAQQQAGKKTILVPLEMFTQGHAMFRCFSRSLRSLKEDFHTIALTPDHCIDDAGAACFSEVLHFNVGDAFLDSPSFIAALKCLPVDAVYYPSLGMANYTLLLANERLAPIQLMSLGHPATSCMDTMDYVLVQAQDLHPDHECLRDIFSEKIVVTANETSSSLARLDHFAFAAHYREKQDAFLAGRSDGSTLNVAITSTHMKINYRFFHCCALIAEASSKKLCFYVFPGANGPVLDFLRESFQSLLPNCKVFATMDYEAYMQALSQCHLRLGTFPFGGANSNMDCFSLALPFVALDGCEVHARSDVGQLQQAGLEELVAANLDEYREKALRLIEDEDYRRSVIRKMQVLADNPFFNGSISEQGAFARSIAFIFDRHEQIQASERQVWFAMDAG